MMPFPKEDVTPPVTNMYLAMILELVFFVTGYKGSYF
jgi:hypothetical protein